jgi:formylglycine-generating enzyme required for sulfatase activity
VKIVRPYYLGKLEVTVGQFKKFAEETGYVTDAEKRGKATGWDGKKWGKKRGANWKNPGFRQESGHPAVALSLNDARAFCHWLGEGYHLPSEAEWEYAARAGSETAFSWGSALADICLYANGGDAAAGRLFPSWKTSTCDDGYAWTAPAGSYRPNRWGFYDTSGNAWEWCADAWHRSFKGAPADQSVWGEAGGGGRRVLKGGSWYFHPGDLRPSWRGTHRASDATNGSGFRVAKDTSAPPRP